MEYLKTLRIYILIFILIYKIQLIHTRVYHITNDDFKLEFVNDLRNIDDEVIVYFDNDYYDLSKQGDINFSSIDITITFVGMGVNGTVFDYKNSNKGTFRMSFMRENNSIITFKNIIFQNFSDLGNLYLSLFLISGERLMNKVFFQGCIFKNNDNLIRLQRDSLCGHINDDKYFKVSFINCQFQYVY